jgi:hypothetical protein
VASGNVEEPDADIAYSLVVFSHQMMKGITKMLRLLRRVFAVTFLLSILFISVSSGNVFASQKKTHPYRVWNAIIRIVPSSQIHVKSTSITRPSNSGNCVKFREYDDGYGITFNALGSQENLNNVQVDAVNTCGIDATNGWWSEWANVTCPSGTSYNQSIAGGTMGYLSAGSPPVNLFTGTVIFRCIEYLDGFPVAIRPPTTVYTMFSLRVNLLGGTSSYNAIVIS